MNPAIRSKSRTACIIGLFVSLLFGWGSALAHQAIVAQLERVNDMINADPDNAEHYIKRGLLYREHLEFEQALLDFRFARELNPELPQAYYQLGRLLLETGDSAAALGYLDQFLVMQPGNLRGMKAKARALSGEGEFVAAAGQYGELIELSGGAGPEIYVERARALQSAGPDYYRVALQGLDDGIRELGNISVLQLAAVDVARLNADWDEALIRLDLLLSEVVRKEQLLEIRGDVLLQAGQTEKAKVSYQSAITAVDGLPSSQRNTSAMSELRARVYAKLNQI